MNEWKVCIDKLSDKTYSENILIFKKRLHLSSGGQIRPTVLPTSLGKKFVALRFISNENILF